MVKAIPQAPSQKPKSAQPNNVFKKAFGCLLLDSEPWPKDPAPVLSKLNKTFDGIEPSIPCIDFIRRGFFVPLPECGEILFLPLSGQTMLRNFGDGQRSPKNLTRLLDAAGFEQMDFSDTGHIADVLASIPGINLRFVTLKEFQELKIDTRLFKGSGRVFLQKAFDHYKGDVSPKWMMYYLFLATGVDRKDYTLEPEKLREALDSCGMDFNDRDIYVKDFMRLRFTSPHVRLNRRNNGSIMGQSLLYRYGGHRGGCTTETLERILSEAGYRRPKRLDLTDPEQVESVLISCTKASTDWKTVKHITFNRLHFSGPIFSGSGESLLYCFGDPTSRGMRQLLKLGGHINKPGRPFRRRQSAAKRLSAVS